MLFSNLLFCFIIFNSKHFLIHYFKKFASSNHTGYFKRDIMNSEFSY